MDEVEPMEVDCKNYFMKIEKEHLCHFCKCRRIGWYLVLYCICDYIFYMCHRCINKTELPRKIPFGQYECIEYHNVPLRGLKKKYLELKAMKEVL